MTDKPKRPWLRFHLSSAVAMTFVAAVLLWAHVTHPIKYGPVFNGRGELLVRCVSSFIAITATLFFWEAHLRTVKQFGLAMGSLRTVAGLVFTWLYFAVLIAVSLLAGFGASKLCALIVGSQEFMLVPACLGSAVIAAIGIKLPEWFIRRRREARKP